MRITILVVSCWFTISLGISQAPLNDECRFATFIDDVDNYCSDGAEFSNLGATPDPVLPAAGCFNGFANIVWFSFIPREPAVLIKVLSGPRVGGTITNPQILLVSDCNEVVQCSPGRDPENDEMTVTNLVIGRLYYLGIESPVGEEGTFELCINDFLNPPSPESDCSRAVVLCDKSPFSIENLNSSGADANEVRQTCIREEFASAWYTWTCDKPGTLTFTLTPNNYIPGQVADDLDFVVYELPNGPRNCGGKIPIRCMASGANQGEDVSEWIRCHQLTGLRAGDGDIEEQPGCQSGNNNFVEAITMVSGRSYALVVNNFSRSGLGFSIEFGGTGTFLGPEPDFDISAVQAFECDKTIMFSNQSQSLTDSIIGYEWNFGEGSSIPFASGEGPHDIVYESFGDKISALAIETLRGCRVTKVVDFYIEPCCADTSNLSVDASVLDVICGGEASGVIEGLGRAGVPQYSFSLDGVNFRPNPLFTGLTSGSYFLFIQDIKGCVDQMEVFIDEPETIRVFAGPDTTIDLGMTTQINAFYAPPDSEVSITWVVDDSLSCNDCLDPESKAPGTTAYIIEIQDQNGCIARDTIVINVNIIRPVFAPNIFSPNADGSNDLFNLFGGPAVSGVDELYVYDRWGNLVYQGENLEINNRDVGWDGTFGGKPLNPGVYTWLAKVKFIDDEVLPFSGDITLLR